MYGATLLVLGLACGAFNNDVQNSIIIQCYKEAIEKSKFSRIKVIDFSWMGKGKYVYTADGKNRKNEFIFGKENKCGNIDVRFTNSEPFQNMNSGEKSKYLVVAQYT
eukprot:UN00351